MRAALRGYGRSMGQPPSYPFTPKSNRYLRPGDYWAVPLADGRYACGRVMAVPAFGPRDRKGIVVGLMDWVGAAPPTSDAIAGCVVVAEAKARFEAIVNTGGAVLGNRPLAVDGIVSTYPRDEAGGNSVRVWGWKTIVNESEKHFA